MKRILSFGKFLQFGGHMRYVFTILIMVSALFLLLSADGASGFAPFHIIDLNGRFFSASSELEDPGVMELGDYGPRLMFDQDPATGWSEGAPGNGIGEYLIVAAGAGAEHVLIQNGFCRSRELFYKNNRVKQFKVSVLYGFSPLGHVTQSGMIFYCSELVPTFTVDVADTMVEQDIPLDLDWVALHEKAARARGLYSEFEKENDISSEVAEEGYFLRLEIADVYPGSKWNDTCISELMIVAE